MITRRGFIASMAALAAVVGSEPLRKLANEARLSSVRDACPGTVRIFINGLLLVEDSDYSINRDRLTFTEPVEPGDVITVFFKDKNGTLNFEHAGGSQ